jgi:hypothetical protein
MKIKLTVFFVTLIFLLSFYSCELEQNSDLDSISDSNSSSNNEWKCGTHNGKTLWTGPRGGCYYYNSNDNKTYVDRSECNC